MVLQCFGPSPINLSIRDNRNRFFFRSDESKFPPLHCSSTVLQMGPEVIATIIIIVVIIIITVTTQQQHRFSTVFYVFICFGFQDYFPGLFIFFSFIQGHILMWKLLRCRFSSLVHSQPLHSQYSGLRMYLHIFIGIKHW